MNIRGFFVEAPLVSLAAAVLISLGIFVGLRAWSSPSQLSVYVSEPNYASGDPAVYLHRMRAGETLFSIANTYGVSVASIAAANDIRNPNYIFAGQVLRIPAPKKLPNPSYAMVTLEGPSEMMRKRSGSITVTAQIVPRPPERQGIIPVSPAVTYTATLHHTGGSNIQILPPSARSLSSQEPVTWTGTIYASEEWEGPQTIRFKVSLYHRSGEPVTQQDLPYADYEVIVKGRRDWRGILVAFVLGGGGFAGYLRLFFEWTGRTRKEKTTDAES